jgi:hypothetical protein
MLSAEPLPAQVEPEALLADKGYDADSFINSLEVRAIKAVIAPKSNRKVKRACDFALYAERNLVERFFNAIKHYRGIATRYEKRATSLPDESGLRTRLGRQALMLLSFKPERIAGTIDAFEPTEAV